INITIDIIKRPVDFDIVVTDTGSGISPENIDEIFNPFFTTKGDSGGTGLGLYIVYNEVSKMNGRINVTSEVGKGTQFVVTLPIEE
ncbi:MAG: HAMP domain-containing histidine kinase, partial [Firmicutes bacterium]|nr:HAMP domain-containing histidine kinase [Bacillota bacterium]